MPDAVGLASADELINAWHNGGAVDKWMQDQLIIFAALASGESKIACGSKPLTLHTQTALAIVRQMCGCTVRMSALDNIITIQGIDARGSD